MFWVELSKIWWKVLYVMLKKSVDLSIQFSKWWCGGGLRHLVLNMCVYLVARLISLLFETAINLLICSTFICWVVVSRGDVLQGYKTCEFAWKKCLAKLSCGLKDYYFCWPGEIFAPRCFRRKRFTHIAYQLLRNVQYKIR